MDGYKRRFVWLDMVERGTTVQTIAHRHKLAIPIVQAAIDDARAQLIAHVEALRLMTVPLVLFFPINGLRPDSTCNHAYVPLPDGDMTCCAVCHQTGVENHPVFDRFPGLEPKPDPVPRPALAETGAEPATRREKRAAAAAKRASKKQTAA